MKKTRLLSVITALLLSSNSLFAQSIPVVNKLPKFDLGIKLGANFAKIGGDNWEQTYQPGIVTGAFMGLHKHKLGLQVEALINTSHYKTSGIVDSIHKGEFRAIYFDIPVLLQYKLVGAKLAPKVWIMAGPQFSNLISVKNVNAIAGDAKETFKSSTVSLVAGAEVRYMKFTLGARYLLGLTNMNNSSASNAIHIATNTWNNRSYQLYLGFRFI